MHKKIAITFNSISFAIIIGLCAIIPLLFLPATVAALGVIKGFALYVGVFLSVSFWLVSQFIEGSLKIPRSPAFLALGSWVVLSLVSALTSTNVSVSLWGRSFVFDSFATTLVLSLFVFMIATFARDQRKLVTLFLTTFVGSAITVLLQCVLFLSKNAPFVSKYLGHVSNQGTLVGSWVDFTYFVTFVFLLALLMYEVLIPKGFFKIVSFGTMVISLIALVFLNFKAAWLVTIVSSLLIFVYKSSVERSLQSQLPSLLEEEKTVDADTKQHFPIMSFVSLLVGLLFFLGSNSIGVSASRFAGVSFTDIRPAFSTTTSVMRSSLYKDPLFGPGAGTYSDVWNMYHPSDINPSIFWNAPFETGFNLLQSTITTNGILPSIAFIVVLVLTLIHGFRLFNYQFPDRFTRFIAVASLIMTVATISLFLFGSPGIVLIVFGFTYIGLLFGVSSLVGKTKVASIEYLQDPRLSFFAILLLVVSSMVGFSAVYFTSNRFASMVLYNKAVAATDAVLAERQLARAISLSNNPVYWKAATLLTTRQFGELAVQENPDKTQLQNLFTKAERSAQTAVALDPGNALYWLDLSQVYQLVAASGNTDALANAKQTALEAEKRNPNNPLFKLNNARIALIEKDTPGALAIIDTALALKPNYLDAFILRGQIRRDQGETNGVRDELLKYVAVAPSDDQGHSLLGSVYLNAKSYDLALASFARARSLAPNNPNYYLSYISVLEASGDRAKAVEELKAFKVRFPSVSGVDEQISRLENNTSVTPPPTQEE